MDNLEVTTGEGWSRTKHNGLLRLCRSNRIFPGPGIKLHTVEKGVIISADFPPAVWEHCWQVSLVDGMATIIPGFVNGRIPTISGVPLGGDEETKKPDPKLRIIDRLFNAHRMSWICIEVTCTEDWSALEKAEMVQVADISTDDGSDGGGSAKTDLGSMQYPSLSKRRSRYPVALLRKSKVGDVRVIDIAHFAVRHVAKKISDTEARHFFQLA